MRAACNDSARPDGPADVLELVDISSGPVDDHAADATIFGQASHQAAADRDFRVSASVHHNDVPRLPHFKGLQGIHQIAFRKFDCDRLTHRLGLERRLDRRIHDAGPVHNVGKDAGHGIGSGNRIELGQQLRTAGEIIEHFEHGSSSGDRRR